MTSCDGNLMKFIPIQLESIEFNLKGRYINFYLFHDGQNISYVNKLKKIKYNNIKFHDVVIPEEEASKYELIANKGGGGCGAAYYSLCAHKHLPEKMDRILYLDTADIMVIDNIDDYYFDDFEGKSIIATALRYIRSNGQVVPYEKEDLMRGDLFAEIAHGLFNSGSYVINLEKLRNENYTIDNYLLCAEMMYDIKDHIPKDYFKDQKHLGHWGDQVYWGDQGFLSLMFVGDIKYFAYPKMKNTMYMPYNFGIWYFNRSDILQYNISIIHYTGDGEKKPWYMKFPIFLSRFQNKDKLYPLDNVNSNLIDCYKIWYGYALMANLRLDNCKIKGL